MIELVPMAWRIVREVGSPNTALPSNGNGGGGGGSSVGGTRDGGGGGTQGGEVEEQEQEERDAVFYRLEMLGYRVGQGLVERFVLLFPFSLQTFPQKRRGANDCTRGIDSPRIGRGLRIHST
jgi:hypothetical protein